MRAGLRAVPVGIPTEAVVGTVERQTELAGGMKWVGGKVIREAVKNRPYGGGGMGEEAVPEVVRKVGVGGCESGDEVVFGRPH